MATVYWIGTGAGNDGDWNTAGNWSTSTVPTTGDVVIFDGRSSQDVTTAPTGANDGLNFALLHVKSSFTASIGASDQKVKCRADKLVIEGSGTYYFTCAEETGAASSSIPITIINNSSATVYLSSDLNSTSYVSEFTEIICFNVSSLTLEDNCWCDKLYVMPYMGRASNASVTIGTGCHKQVTGSEDKTDIYMLEGSLTTNSGINQLYVTGGTVNIGTASGGGTGVDILTLVSGPNATINWYPDEDNAYIGKAYIFGGRLNADGTTNQTRAKVLGDGMNDIYLFAGATLSIDNGMGNITVAPGSKLINMGGTLEADENAELSITYNS